MKLLELRRPFLSHRLTLFVLISFLVGTAAWAPTLRAEESKPKYGPDAIPLSVSQSYFKNHFPPLFWKMIPYYVHQQNGWSCGIVSSAIALNAARAILNLTPQLKADQPLFYESDLVQYLQKNQALSKYSGKGVALSELGEILRETAKDFKLNQLKIEAVHLDNDSELKAKEKHLHELLMTLEKSDKHLIIANFNQGVYTGDADVGHYSPVAAYDSANKKVLILDTDRQWYEPYWVSEEVFLKGMKTMDKSTNKNRGYIHIELVKQ